MRRFARLDEGVSTLIDEETHVLCIVTCVAHDVTLYLVSRCSSLHHGVGSNFQAFIIEKGGA